MFNLQRFQKWPKASMGEAPPSQCPAGLLAQNLQQLDDIGKLKLCSSVWWSSFQDSETTVSFTSHRVPQAHKIVLLKTTFLFEWRFKAFEILLKKSATGRSLQMNFWRSVQNVSSQWPRKGFDTCQVAKDIWVQNAYPRELQIRNHAIPTSKLGNNPSKLSWRKCVETRFWNTLWVRWKSSNLQFLHSCIRFSDPGWHWALSAAGCHKSDGNNNPSPWNKGGGLPLHPCLHRTSL